MIIIAGQFLQNPDKLHPQVPMPTRVQVRSHGVDFTSREMLRTPHFYLLFAMALAMGIGGLMTTAQVAPMAEHVQDQRRGA